MGQASQYDILIQKLDRFVRKYYVNRVIRGLIFSTIYILAFFIAINLLEYYLYLPGYLRKVLFWGFILSSGVFTSRFFLLPLLHYYRLGKLISYEQAAQIIGTHFKEVKDKLLNILQLRSNAPSNTNTDLLLAAIDQKASELKPVDFSFAIDLSRNRQYLKYLAPPALLFLFIIIAAPNVIKEGTARLYHNNTVYEKQAPFQFVIQNKELKALQFDNYTLNVKIEGNALPAEVYIEADKNTVRLKKKAQNLFTYEFVNLQKPTEFQFQANGFHSQEYTLDVVAKPVVSGFEVDCNYPAYTGKKNEVLKNTGDLVVPTGSKLTWKFNTQNVDGLTFASGDSVYKVGRTGESGYTFSKTFLQSTSYTIKVSNKNAKDADSVSYSLNVVPDLYPTITVNEKNDTATQKYFYYVGDIADDYGLHRLTFNYQLTRADSSAAALKTVEVPFNAGTASRFTYYWALSDFNIKPGDKMSYYFEVWDNDGVHGPKSTRSTMLNFDMPTLNELNKQLSNDNKELKDDMKEAMKKAEKVKDQLQDMKDKLQEKSNMNWEDKKNLANNIEQQKQLQQQLEDIKNKMDQNFEKQNEFKEINPEIAEKEKNLQELFNQVMNKDMKELFEKLQKMLDQLQKKDALDKMDDMQANSEKLDKELDRMLELFKKLEFQQKLEETADKLDKMAAKQDSLSNQTAGNQDKGADKKNGNEVKDAKAQDQLKTDQAKLNNDLKDAEKDLEDLKKLNDETKSGQDFKDAKQDMNSAEQEQQEAQQSMNQNQNSSASKKQKSAASNMKDASHKLSAMKDKMEQDEDAEDMQAIQQLLKNIIQLSFDEEKLMTDVKETNINNPKYVELMHEQERIRVNSKMVEDSLYALARRQDQIKSFVTKEITNVDKYLGKGIADMEDRNPPRAMENEQYVMTGYNNLALLLSEALQQLQQKESQAQEPKDGQPKMCMKCKKPGNGMPKLSKMQKQLNDKISQAAEMMKKQGQGKPGDKGMSQQFAEMAQMQAQIRKELEKINEQENKNGQQPLGNLGQTTKQMEETEKQLVNKQLTTEMMKRLQEIMSHMLQAENAEREKDQKQERESHTAKDMPRKIPPSLEEYLKAQQSQVDLYKTVSPELKPYYKTLAEKYFRTITNGPQ